MYVKDKFIPELKKLNSYQQKDYSTALREIFIKMDDLLKTPQGKKDVLLYQTKNES